MSLSFTSPFPRVEIRRGDTNVIEWHCQNPFPVGRCAPLNDHHFHPQFAVCVAVVDCFHSASHPLSQIEGMVGDINALLSHHRRVVDDPIFRELLHERSGVHDTYSTSAFLHVSRGHGTCVMTNLGLFRYAFARTSLAYLFAKALVLRIWRRRPFKVLPPHRRRRLKCAKFHSATKVDIKKQKFGKGHRTVQVCDIGCSIFNRDESL
jgi:hypothetical protein